MSWLKQNCLHLKTYLIGNCFILLWLEYSTRPFENCSCYQSACEKEKKIIKNDDFCNERKWVSIVTISM